MTPLQIGIAYGLGTSIFVYAAIAILIYWMSR